MGAGLDPADFQEIESAHLKYLLKSMTTAEFEEFYNRFAGGDLGEYPLD